MRTPARRRLARPFEQGRHRRGQAGAGLAGGEQAGIEVQFGPRHARMHLVAPDVEQPFEPAQGVAGEDGARRAGRRHGGGLAESRGDAHDDGRRRQGLQRQGHGLAVGDALQDDRRAIFAQAVLGGGAGHRIAGGRQQHGAAAGVGDLAQQRRVAVGDQHVAVRRVAGVDRQPAHALQDRRLGAAVEHAHHVAVGGERVRESDDGLLAAAERPLVRGAAVEGHRVVEEGNQHRRARSSVCVASSPPSARLTPAPAEPY